MPISEKEMKRMTLLATIIISILVIGVGISIYYFQIQK